MDETASRARRWARGKLACLVVAALACLVVSFTRDPNLPLDPPPGSTCDREVFETIVARVRAGDSVYDATQAELRSHGYPTRSVFNWRMPFYAWLLATAPSGAWGRGLLIAFSMATLALVCADLLKDTGVIAGATGGTLFIGSMAWCVSDGTYLFTELWAGVAIAFSVSALRRGWTGAGVAAGLFALFYRELALPYVVVSLGLAAWNGRSREAIAWLAGLAGFAAFLGAHALIISGRITPVDTALEGGWIRFGGLRFILATARMNLFLMAVPAWCTAIVLPLSLFGLLEWRENAGRRVALTVAAYIAAFSVVGAPFNYYWGFIDAPLIAIGLAHAPGALRQNIDASAWFPKTADLRRVPASG